jgi:hypothetical protein
MQSAVRNCPTQSPKGRPLHGPWRIKTWINDIMHTKTSTNVQWLLHLARHLSNSLEIASNICWLKTEFRGGSAEADQAGSSAGGINYQETDGNRIEKYPQCYMRKDMSTYTSCDAPNYWP